MVAIPQILNNLVIALIQLVVGLALSVGAVYTGIRFLDKLTKDIDEWDEIKKGNVAVGVLLAGIILSVALIVENGVVELIGSINPGPSFNLIIINLVASVINLAISILVAMFAIYLGIRLIDKVTPQVDEIKELKKKNVAIGIIMAAVLIAVAFVIRGSVVEIIDAINIRGLLLSFF